jgi:hypothetical protein
MPERPLLVFPQSAVIGRRKKPGGAGEINKPSPQRQVQRLENKIAAIEQHFNRRHAEMRSDPVGAEPEDVLVLETIGTVKDFMRAVNRLPGLEWLGDVDIGDIPADEDFYTDEEHRKPLTGRLYLIMSNQQGIQELLRLFNIFRTNPDHPQFEFRQGRWRHIFSNLRDIRRWGPEDRLRETGLIEDWQNRVQYGEEIVPLEVELWFRTDAARRAEAYKRVSQHIVELRGEVVNQAILEEIRYHALVGRIPVQNVENLNNLQETRLVKSSDIMLLRPLGQASMPLPEEDSTPGFSRPTSPLPTEKQPIVALLDGLPLENHLWLDGRLIVDDIDNWAADIQAGERVHGTAMASLILHGELDNNEDALAWPLYIRPIMKSNPSDWRRHREESIPDHILPADLIHKAVRRVYESNDGEEPVAPTIRIINLSVCDRSHQFYQYPSPWARILDYLSWHYNILFVVSAGNYTNDLNLGAQIADWSALLTDPAKLQEQILIAINNDARNRRLLVPAEAINALAIGALHGDSSRPSLSSDIVDPFPNYTCVSPFSAQGVGFRRSVKPDILMPGGRQIYRDNIVGNNGKVVLTSLKYSSMPGQRVASPNQQAGIIDATTYTRGTSNAAALATRLAAQLYSQVMDIRSEPNGNLLADEYIPVIIKALIVHGSSWSFPGRTVQNLLQTNDKDMLTRLLGYGVVDKTRLFECTESRATILGCGSLNDGEAHSYNIPLPPSLNGRMTRRRLTVTLAWISPINSSHQGYRVAGLWFEPYGNDISDGNAMDILRIARQEVHWQTARRGTVQHEIFEGEEISSFGPEDVIRVQVNCSADAGNLHESVRYALVVSLEVAPGQGIPIYNEIRMRIQQPVTIAVGTDIIDR